MKLLLTTFISALCWSCRLAAAADTHVYTIDVPRASERKLSTTLSPKQAREVVAQRTGVEGFHAIDLEDAESVRAINAFGRRQGLFAQPKANAKNVLVLVEGVDEQREYL